MQCVEIFYTSFFEMHKTYAMMLAGLGMVGAIARRRRIN